MGENCLSVSDFLFISGGRLFHTNGQQLKSFVDHNQRSCTWHNQVTLTCRVLRLPKPEWLSSWGTGWQAGEDTCRPVDSSWLSQHVVAPEACNFSKLSGDLSGEIGHSNFE